MADGSCHASASLPPSAFSLSMQLSPLVYIQKILTLQLPIPMCCCQNNNYCYSLTISAHTPFWLSFISVIFEAHLWASCLKLSWLPIKSRCTKLLLTVCMWPVTVAKVSKTYKTTNTRYMQKIAIQPTGGGLAHACPTHCWGILGSWSHFSAHLESIVCQSVVPHFSDTSYTQN